MSTAYACVIDAIECAARDDRDGALRLVAQSRVDPELLRECAVTVFAGVMSGDDAATRFDEQRNAILQLAEHVGADDRQVVLCLEVVGAAQALCDGDEERVKLIVSESVFSALDHAHVAASLTGQAIAGWLGARPGVHHAVAPSVRARGTYPSRRVRHESLCHD